MKIILETERLILRPFELSDAESMFNNWANDDEVTKYVTWNTHKSIEETKHVLSIWVNEYEKEERINFAIVYKENNELIGGIDVVGYFENVPVIGYNLSRKYWNKGIMTEACKRVIELLFSLNYDKIIVEALVENIGSNRVIQKCGGVYQTTYNQFITKKEKEVTINKYIIEKRK